MHFSIAGLALLTVASLCFGAFVMEPLIQKRRTVIAWMALIAYVGLVLLLASVYGALP